MTWSKAERIQNWKNWKAMAKANPKKFRCYVGHHMDISTNPSTPYIVTALLEYRRDTGTLPDGTRYNSYHDDWFYFQKMVFPSDYQ